MPGSAARLATLLRALPVVSAPAAAAWAGPAGRAGPGGSSGPVGSSDGPADAAPAVGPTSAAAEAAGTGRWPRSRYRRDADGGDP